SARTTAPSAPRDNSSHRNQKRSWPGVPKRESTRSRSMVIRPKSSATVVVSLDSTPDRSSTPVLTSVMSSSVRSGVISLIAETIVVLPTPNPPAMRILTDAAKRCEFESTRGSKFSDAIQNRSQYVEIAGAGFRLHRGPEDQLSLADQVADENLRHRERKLQVCSYLRDRLGLCAEPDDYAVFRLRPAQGRRLVGGDDHRQHVQIMGRAHGAAADQRVGTDHRSGRVVEERPAFARHDNLAGVDKKLPTR